MKKTAVVILMGIAVFVMLSLSSPLTASANPNQPGHPAYRGQNSENDELLNSSLNDIMLEVVRGFARYWNDTFIGADGSSTIGGSLLPDNTVPGNAGGMMGIAVRQSDGWIAGIASFFTSSSASVGYDALANFTASSWVPAPANEPLYAYAMYGYVLSDMGLYHTGKSNIEIFRPVMGALLYVSYLLTITVTWIFKACLDLLAFFNPFTWLSAMSGWMGGATVGWVPRYQETPLAPIMEFTGNIFEVLQELGVLLIPIMIGAIVVSVFLFRKAGGVGSSLWRVMARIIIVIAAMPLIGGLYSGFLTSMEDSTDQIEVGAARIVAKTLFDFEAWARNQRLAPPNDNNGGGVIRYNGLPPRFGYHNASRSSSQVALTINGWNYPGLNTTISDQWDTSGSAFGRLGDVNTDRESLRPQMLGLIARYMRADKFSSASYDSTVRSDLLRMQNDSNWQAEISRWFNYRGSVYVESSHADLIWTNNGHKSIFNNGDLVQIMHGYNNYSFQSASASGIPDESPVRVRDSGGLSTLAMYNFLNSSFDESGLTLYAPTTTPSIHSRAHVYSVNAVGTGLVRFLNVAASVMQLSMIMIIGISYCFGMLFSNIKRGFGILFSTPLVLLGSPQGLAKVLGATFLMIIEIIGTVFIYQVVTELIIIFDAVIFQLFDSILVALAISSAVMPMMSTALILLAPLISIIMYFMLIKTALGFRKKFIRTMDEIVMGAVDKFVTAFASGSGRQAALAGGVPTGSGKMGMAMVSAAGAAGVMGFARSYRGRQGGSGSAGNDSKDGDVREADASFQRYDGPGIATDAPQVDGAKTTLGNEIGDENQNKAVANAAGKTALFGGKAIVRGIAGDPGAALDAQKASNSANEMKNAASSDAKEQFRQQANNQLKQGGGVTKNTRGSGGGSTVRNIGSGNMPSAQPAPKQGFNQQPVPNQNRSGNSLMDNSSQATRPLVGGDNQAGSGGVPTASPADAASNATNGAPAVSAAADNAGNLPL